MRTISVEYGSRCREQSLGAIEHAECMKKLAESIILQCIEDLWDRSSMHGSISFFSKRGFSTCAAIAGMAIGEQIKLLDLINRAMYGIRRMQQKRSGNTGNRRPSSAASKKSFGSTKNRPHLFTALPIQHGAH